MYLFLMVSEVTEFLEQQVQFIDQNERASTLASWNANITGEDRYYAEGVEVDKKANAFYSSKENFQRVNEFLAQELDEQTRRQLEIIRLGYMSAQADLTLLDRETEIASDVEKKFNLFRANVNGRTVTDNEIKEILKESTDSAVLSEAWNASKLQGELVAPQVLELVKIRNQIAAGIGFRNYCDFSLAMDEQTEEEVSGVLDRLEVMTREPYRKLKGEMDMRLAARLKLRPEELKPWHYQDLFFQEGPKATVVDLDAIYGKHDVIQIAKKFYADIGLDVEDILARSDLFEKAGKNQHAFCTIMNREGDVRILENVVNNEDWMATTQHELGHAVYEKHSIEGLPFLLRSHPHTFVTESIAMVMERLTKNPKFIKKYTGVEISEEDQVNLKEMQRQRQLVFARWVMTVYNFERELYSNPGQDLNTKW